MNRIEKRPTTAEESGVVPPGSPPESVFRSDRSRRRKSHVRIRRKIDPSQFAAVLWNRPDVPAKEIHWGGALLAASLAAGMAIGVLWPQRPDQPAPKEDLFVFEEEIPPLPPESPPTPPDPEPLPPKPQSLPEEPPPPPQFGLEEETLSESGDLAAAPGNTLMMAADTIVAPPPPPLPPGPLFAEQPPRRLSGPEPEYPSRALDRGLEGAVIALVTIDSNGKVQDVSIRQSVGWEFEESVIASLRQSSYQPPFRFGKPAACKFRQVFAFELEH